MAAALDYDGSGHCARPGRGRIPQNGVRIVKGSASGANFIPPVKYGFADEGHASRVET